MHLTKTEQEQTTVFGNRRLQALQDHADTDLTLFAKPAGPNEGHTRWGIGALGAEDKWILLAHDEGMYEIINSTRNGGWERRAMAHMQLSMLSLSVARTSAAFSRRSSPLLHVM